MATQNLLPEVKLWSKSIELFTGAHQLVVGDIDPKEYVSLIVQKVIRIDIPELFDIEQPDVLEPFEAQFDYVQVMGIAKVGFQGQPFDVHALHLLERLRLRYPSLPLQIDGGVTLENAHQLAKVGATGLVVGSAIFTSNKPLEEIKKLQAEANRMV